MDSFNEDLLLPKEWLIKVDPKTSTPYLIKFHSSTVDLTCSIMITDTKLTWVEALSTNQFARRWRECNKRADSPSLDHDQEEGWRTRSLDLLSRAHTLAGIPDLSFEVVEPKFGDLAFQIECNTFKWRWETIFVGYKISADILSKHLILPMITSNHLAFSSPDVVGDLSPTDLDKAIDKLARTARRAVDTHVKNALSKPRLATTIRRITAVFNFISDPPNVSTDAISPVLLPTEPIPKLKKSFESLKTMHISTLEPNDRRDGLTSSKRASIAPSRRSSPLPIKRTADSGSATEPEDDVLVQPSRLTSGVDQPPDIPMRSPTPPRENEREAPYNSGNSRSRSATKAPPSDTDSSPARPVKKKPKALAFSSDEDSKDELGKKPAPVKRGAGPSALGPRQPIKRGGKRF